MFCFSSLHDRNKPGPVEGAQQSFVPLSLLEAHNTAPEIKYLFNYCSKETAPRLQQQIIHSTRQVLPQWRRGNLVGGDTNCLASLVGWWAPGGGALALKLIPSKVLTSTAASGVIQAPEETDRHEDKECSPVEMRGPKGLTSKGNNMYFQICSQ